MLDLEANTTAIELDSFINHSGNNATTGKKNKREEKPPAIAGDHITSMQLKILNNSLFTKRLATQSTSNTMYKFSL